MLGGGRRDCVIENSAHNVLGDFRLKVTWSTEATVLGSGCPNLFVPFLLTIDDRRPCKPGDTNRDEQEGLPADQKFASPLGP